MPDTTTFGAIAKQSRLDAALSLRAAAKQLEISPSYLSKMELNKCDPPSAELIEEMATLYGVRWEVLARYAKDRSQELIGSETQAKKHLLQLFRVARDLPDQDVKQLLDRFISELDPEKRDAIKALLQDTEFPRKNNRQPMQVKPRVLSKRDLRRRAEKVLAAFGLDRESYKPPTPIEEIIERTRNVCLCIRDDFQRRSDGTSFVLGVTKWDRSSPNTKLIEIDESLYESNHPTEQNRLRFTLGHEYFHAIEHLELAKQQLQVKAELNRLEFAGRRTDSSRKKLVTHEDWQEWQANQFAAEILMPAWSVARHVRAVIGSSRFSAVAKSSTKETVARRIGSHEHDGVKIHQEFGVSLQAMTFRLIDLGIVV